MSTRQPCWLSSVTTRSSTLGSSSTTSATRPVPLGARRRGVGAGAGSGTRVTGSSMVKIVSPGRLCTLSLPPCSSRMPYDTLRPRPVPLPTIFVVKNGSKTRASASGAMPGPSSTTSA